jgi:hypothetical protein
MASPPKDVPASELFQRLLARPAPSMVFPFPRRGEDGEPIGSVRVFVLSDKQLQSARVKARSWMGEQAKSCSPVTEKLDQEIIGDRVAKEILAMSVHEDRQIGDSGHYLKMFRHADDVGELTGDELAQLYGAYLVCQQQFGPTDASFDTDEEVNEWVARLSEGGGHFLLSLLQSHQRDELLLKLVLRASCMSTALSSSPPGSLPTCLESNRETWRVGIDLSTEDAASSTESPAEPPELISPEAAIAAARAARQASAREG